MNTLKIMVLLLLINFSAIFAEEYQVKKTKDNLVKFISSTSLSDFDGITEKIDGYIYWEGDEPFKQNNQLYFEVDLNSVKTGIGKRDTDMREDVLETYKWPKTHFTGKITGAKKEEKETYKITSIGKMFIHGKEKEITLTAVITRGNNILHVKSDFSVFLKDYDIEAPSLLAFVKVADQIKIHLNFILEKTSGE